MEPIGLEDLLRQRGIEGGKIDCKTGWNPDAMLRRGRGLIPYELLVEDSTLLQQGSTR